MSMAKLYAEWKGHQAQILELSGSPKREIRYQSDAQMIADFESWYRSCVLASILEQLKAMNHMATGIPVPEEPPRPKERRMSQDEKDRWPQGQRGYWMI